MIELIQTIRKTYPDCAITLSIGEKSYETYRAFYEAGANRYLLRHETFNARHYESLHPAGLTAAKTPTMSVGFKIYRLSSRNRLHGWLTRTDGRTSG